MKRARVILKSRHDDMLDESFVAKLQQHHVELDKPKFLEQPVTGTYLRGHIFGKQNWQIPQTKILSLYFLLVWLFYSAAVSMLSEIYKRFPRDMKKSNLFCASFSYNSCLGFFLSIQFLEVKCKIQNTEHFRKTISTEYFVWSPQISPTKICSLRYILALVAKKNKTKKSLFLAK